MVDNSNFVSAQVRSCYDEGKRCAETLFFDDHRQHGLEIKVVQFSELQRRVPSVLRTPLLRLNNFYFRNGLPAGPATANMLIFRKEP